MKVSFLGILDKILLTYSTIVYDASSRLKEFGLAKEPSRFMQVRFVTNPLHKEVHDIKVGKGSRDFASTTARK